MSDILPTVVISTSNGPTVINESDFDPSVHKLYGAAVTTFEFSGAAAAKFAEESGITSEELATIKPTGNGGKISKEDLKNFLELKGLMVLPVEGGFQLFGIEGTPFDETKYATAEEAQAVLDELKK